MTDLTGVLERAARAARRGDLQSLEVEIRRLRALPVHGRASIISSLRSVARSVRSHPAARPARTARAS